MITYAAACPACRAETRFTPTESQVYAESLMELQVDPYADPRHPGADDHQLYGYCLARCPQCAADVIVHFNIPLHRFLALLQTLLPEAYAAAEEVSAQALFERLAGDLRSFTIDPDVDRIDL